MAKTKTQVKENPSTLKSRKRNLQMNVVARRLLNDSTAKWSSVGTKFIAKLFPVGAVANEMPEHQVRGVIRQVLQEMMDNLNAGKAPGIAEDIREVLALAPRVRRRKNAD